MKPARLAVLAIAISAGGGAAYLMSGSEPPPPPPPAQPAPPPPPPVVAMTDILVAAADLPIGQTLKERDLRWQPWPDAALSAGYITRTASPEGLAETTGSIIRSGFLANEPIRSEKLVKAGSGFMSAILPSGLRAVAVEIMKGGATSAGGFILPNDHVDVIRTFREDGGPPGAAGAAGAGGEPMVETILMDIRVLAVGQIIQEKNGETVVTGETATLALTPSQAETVTLAQKAGTVSLVLRSILDSGGTATEPEAKPETALTVVRFGVSKQQARR